MSILIGLEFGKLLKVPPKKRKSSHKEEDFLKKTGL